MQTVEWSGDGPIPQIGDRVHHYGGAFEVLEYRVLDGWIGLFGAELRKPSRKYVDLRDPAALGCRHYDDDRTCADCDTE